MNEPPEDIKLRLLFILHQGFVEARLLSGGGRNQQVFDLADVMELIPAMLKDWHADDLDKIKILLKPYQDKYEWRFDFISRLEDKDPLPF